MGSGATTLGQYKYTLLPACVCSSLRQPASLTHSACVPPSQSEIALRSSQCACATTALPCPLTWSTRQSSFLWINSCGKHLQQSVCYFTFPSLSFPTGYVAHHNLRLPLGMLLIGILHYLLTPYTRTSYCRFTSDSQWSSTDDFSSYASYNNTQCISVHNSWGRFRGRLVLYQSYGS